MEKLSQFLKKVLDIIDFKGDKEKFINDIIVGINLKTAHLLIQSLTPSDQQEVKKLIDGTDITNANKLGQFLKDKLGESSVNETLKTSTQEIIASYLKELSPSLSGQQRSELQSYLTLLNN